MEDVRVIYADPWLKKAEETTSLPEGARFACAYEIDLAVERFNETAFFCRTETTDELWIGSGGIADGSTFPKEVKGMQFWTIGCVFAIQTKAEDTTACLKLLELFFRARHGFEWPDRFVASGIIDEFAFDNLVGGIEKELEENKQKARSAETEIVSAARDLGLFPKPTGEGPTHWYARCPETNHVLFLDTATNSFGCGWCKRKGTIQELRAFVNERKDRRTRC